MEVLRRVVFEDSMQVSFRSYSDSVPMLYPPLRFLMVHVYTAEGALTHDACICACCLPRVQAPSSIHPHLDLRANSPLPTLQESEYMYYIYHAPTPSYKVLSDTTYCTLLLHGAVSSQLQTICSSWFTKHKAGQEAVWYQRGIKGTIHLTF